ncbi:MAG: hypothetical protein R3236_10500 [Phycisphaeraceae bacterium]|nr:hypothetical protein [Phycisphaeraceae bacterium]
MNLRHKPLGFLLLLTVSSLQAQKAPEAGPPKPGPAFPKKSIAQLKQILNGSETGRYTVEEMKQLATAHPAWVAAAKVTGHDGHVLESERRFTSIRKIIDGRYRLVTLRRPDLKEPVHSISTYHKPTHCYVRWIFTKNSTRAAQYIGITEPGGRTIAWARFGHPNLQAVSITHQGEDKTRWSQVLFEKNRFRYRLDGSARPAGKQTPPAETDIQKPDKKTGALLPTLSLREARLIASAPHRDRMDIEEMKVFFEATRWTIHPQKITQPDGRSFTSNPSDVIVKKVDGKYLVSRTQLPPDVPLSYVTITTYHKPTRCFVRWMLIDPEGQLVRSIGIRLPGTRQLAWTYRNRNKTGKLVESVGIETRGTKKVTWSKVTFKDGRFLNRSNGKGIPAP